MNTPILDLDDVNAIKVLDKGNAHDSIQMLPQQCEEAWKNAANINFPSAYQNAKHVVIAGMGGSLYGGRILKSLYDTDPKIRIPFELANGYHLPSFANSNTLVFLCSYSGTTEETLSCSKEAEQKKVLISGITSGGSLGEFLKLGNYPSYIFNPKANPSNQPRIGVGYMVIGLLALLSRLEYIPLEEKEVEETINYLSKKGTSLNASSQKATNEAKLLAENLKGKIPVLISADFLEGGARAIRNPIHETGKQFGLAFTIPELNHHLMEGLRFPKEANKYLKFIFVESDLYEERNKKRLALTKDIVEKNGIETLTLTLKARTKLTQTMELIQLGGWFTFYLAIQNGVDPSPVPWVDYFKKELVR